MRPAHQSPHIDEGDGQIALNNLRTYGSPPFEVAVLHGGPGAPGSAAPLARELASDWGVLEPLQTAASVEGQIEELRAVLEQNADGPVTLIGWSWGAMLGFMLAARAPELVRTLFLVGSGPYEARYAADIDQTRLSRLSEEERQRIQELAEAMNDPAVEDKSPFLAELGALFGKADDYDPITVDSEELGVQFDIFERVWSEVVELRASGALLELGKRIRCPVVAIHGDYDPHPAAGVREPLARTLEDFRFVLLEHCGHTPWVERYARDGFHRIVRAEIGK